jgi:hypothetical protein
MCPTRNTSKRVVVVVSLGEAGVRPFLSPGGRDLVWLNEDGVVWFLQLRMQCNAACPYVVGYDILG